MPSPSKVRTQGRVERGCLIVLNLDMPRRLPPGCVEDKDRHGNWRIYYRSRGNPEVRLHGTPWTTEFMAAYEEAMGGSPKPIKRGIGVGT